MTEKFVITGMTCAACAAHVERAAASVPGVHSASVNLMLGSLVCDRDENVDPAAIVAAVTAAGYGAVPESEARRDLHAEQDAAVKAMGRRLLWSVVCLVPLFYLSMGHMMGLPVPMFVHTQPLLSAFVLLALTVPILILNRSYFTVGFSRLFKGAPNMDSLVALGAAAGLVYSLIEMGLLAAGKVTGMPDLYFESAGMILALVTVGKYLEERSKGKTTGAITALLALAPESAVVRRDGKEVTVPTEDIKAGETVIVRQGGRIPVDGTVTAGSGTVDESALTGESMPVEKTVGGKAVSATILTGGYLELTADRVGADTTLSQIIQLMEQAASGKAPISRLADKISAVFVPVVIGIALAAAVRTRFGHLSRLHWRQLALAVEILILFSVSFFPPEHHLAANSLTSLACGIQVQAFRKIEGNGIATTMCIGNLRAGVQALHEYHIAHDREELRRGALYFAVIIFFALGAVAGNLLVFRYGLLAIRWDCLLLLLPLLLMLQKPDEAKKETL